MSATGSLLLPEPTPWAALVQICFGILTIVTSPAQKVETVLYMEEKDGYFAESWWVLRAHSPFQQLSQSVQHYHDASLSDPNTTSLGQHSTNRNPQTHCKGRKLFLLEVP